jgi:hypothetical protein
MTNINYIQLVDPINSSPLAEEQSRRWPVTHPWVRLSGFNSLR